MEIVFFAISGVYAAAGFAGGSSFLAALTMAGVPLSTAAIASLACNAASAVSVLVYARKCGELLRDYFWILLPGALAAAAGSRIHLHSPLFTALLGASLTAAAWSIFFRPLRANAPAAVRSGPEARSIPILAQAGLGILAGGAGGMTGIGGGILLAVLLHMFFRGSLDQRRLSLLTALFILINSITGLVVRVHSAAVLPRLPGIELLILSAFLGGAIGRIASQNLAEISLRRVTAGAVAAPGIWMIWSML